VGATITRNEATIRRSVSERRGTPGGARFFSAVPRARKANVRKPGPRSARVAAASVALFLASLASTACVERKLLIDSDPPGARVFINEDYRGETPLEIDYLHYGSRLIEMRLPGFVPERFQQSVPAPWYQWFPLDLITDVFIPFTIHDTRRVRRTLRLEPPVRNDDARREEIRERAEEFRDRLEADRTDSHGASTESTGTRKSGSGGT